MPSSLPKVYLDHLIRRDSLLYKRTAKSGEENTSPQDYLQIINLYGDDEWGFLMRKPDFQRATRSWTPAECVELLEAVLGEQVVPSIILWKSPESLIYVLDGGHRISVLLAWVKDDWGETAAAHFGDAALGIENKEAARQVRLLLKNKGIGVFRDWQGAARQYKELIKEDKEPALQMSPPELHHAEQFNGWKSKKTGFPILWVRGDYETAERSFLKINKTGRRLSEWETKLVENRSSSFARVVMSLANINDAAHCWPAFDAENPQNNDALKTKIEGVIKRIEELNTLLFEPPFTTPINSAKQPLFAISLSRPDLRPAYAAELLTITSGKKGKKAETEALISFDRKATATNQCCGFA